MINKIVDFFGLVGYRILVKIGLRIQVSSLQLFLRYCVVGVIATVVDYALLYGLTEFYGLWYLFSATISFIAAATVSYYLNRIWTFNNNDSRIARQVGIFLVISGVGIIINNTILVVGVEVIGMWYMLAKVFSTAVTLIWNFIGHKYITFRAG